MSVNRPEPGAELNAGEATVPRLAATVILLRGGEDGLEVLLAQRTPKARFMGGAWVFPGGAVSPDDGDGEPALRAAGARELAEEAGIVLGDPAELVAFSRWITPAEVKIRYDTWFFLAALPEGAEPVIDGEEVVDARWYAPSTALEAGRREEILLVFPTIKHLERLSGFASAADLLRYAAARTVQPVQPRVVGSGEQVRILLPGEPGYDD
ncbi:MAG: NUDIX hydrolase [Actinomycetota bacterium]|nr:NUDIX hydrolase [Actinomycetota bacterium]